MSIYGRYIWDITVPAGGWDIDNNALAAPATVPAGTYDIFEFCAELKVQCDLDAAGNKWTFNVDSLGTVSIYNDGGAWVMQWLTTDDALEAALGLDGTEGPDGTDTLYSTAQHGFGYYPGLLSFGYNIHQGCGIINTRLWKPNWPMVRARAGNHAMRTVGPATPSEQMELQYGIIKDAEYNDELIGLKGFINACVAITFKFYPDRAVGTVVGLPHAQDTDYWLCTIDMTGDVRARQQGGPGFLTWQVSLNREP